MTKNGLNDAFDLFATIKAESNELFREVAVILEAYDEKLQHYDAVPNGNAWICGGYDVPKSNSKTSVIRRIVTLRDDLNRLSQILKEG